MKVFYSPECEKYWQEGHPEHPRRTKRSYELLQDRFDFVNAESAEESDILTVHTHELVNAVRHRKFLDNDTPNLPKMFEHAKLAAGSAIQAMKTALANENGFSLMRPPGHHAGKNFLGGFCYFNNLAIAVKLALKSTDKVAIIDIDGHHGNGTQDIFLGDKNVLFISLHQKNAFPISGFTHADNCLNFPLMPGTKSDVYLDTLEKALDNVFEFDPDIVAVSAGFDTYRLDPLLELELEREAYYEIARMIKNIEKPCFAVLEGGYHTDLPRLIFEFLSGLRD